MSRPTIKVNITAAIGQFTTAMSTMVEVSRRTSAQVRDWQRTPDQRAVHNHLIAIAAATYADLGLIPPADSVVRERLPIRSEA